MSSIYARDDGVVDDGSGALSSVVRHEARRRRTIRRQAMNAATSVAMAAITKVHRMRRQVMATW